MRRRKVTAGGMGLAQGLAKKLGIDKRNARPAELILTQQLSPTQSTYRFSLEDKDQPSPLAKGLKDRNGFIALAMGVGFSKVPIFNNTEYPGANPIIHHPDPNVFTVDATAPGVLNEAQALEHIYNTGRYSIKTNQGVRVDAETMRHFRTVLETQNSATTASMQTGEELKPLKTAVLFGGGDNNEIIIDFNCKDMTAINGDAASNNYLAVILAGFILHGSTTKLYTR